MKTATRNNLFILFGVVFLCAVLCLAFLPSAGTTALAEKLGETVASIDPDTGILTFTLDTSIVYEGERIIDHENDIEIELSSIVNGTPMGYPSIPVDIQGELGAQQSFNVYEALEQRGLGAKTFYLLLVMRYGDGFTYAPLYGTYAGSETEETLKYQYIPRHDICDDVGSGLCLETLVNPDVGYQPLPIEGGTLSSGDYFLDREMVELQSNLVIPNGASVNICMLGRALWGQPGTPVITVEAGAQLCIHNCAHFNSSPLTLISAPGIGYHIIPTTTAADISPSEPVQIIAEVGMTSLIRHAPVMDPEAPPVTPPDKGGLILNHGQLKMQGITFVAGEATQAGGALYNDGYCLATRINFIGCKAPKGGAIYSDTVLLEFRFEGTATDNIFIPDSSSDEDSDIYLGTGNFIEINGTPTIIDGPLTVETQQTAGKFNVFTSTDVTFMGTDMSKFRFVPHPNGGVEPGGTLPASLQISVNHAHAHCSCGQAWDGNTADHCGPSSGHANTEFTPLTAVEAMGSALTTGSYYLTEDLLTGTGVGSGERIEIAENAVVTLCLNGKRIQANDTFAAIYVCEGATLNICDCGTDVRYFNIHDSSSSFPNLAYEVSAADKDDNSIAVMGGIITGNPTSSQGSYGITIAANGTLNMYGGTIIGNRIDNNTTTNGIITNYGSLNIYRGALRNNVAYSSGIIFNNDTGAVNLAGDVDFDPASPDDAREYTVKIYQNYGSGIVNFGTVNMSQAYIGYNDVHLGGATASSSGGGGIYVGSGAALNITGGQITHNKARTGAGIYVQGGTCTINSNSTPCVDISYNTASVIGGGICVDDGILTIPGSALIRYNACEQWYGGGIVLGYYSSCILGTEGSENAPRIIYNSANTQGGGLYTDRPAQRNGYSIPVSLTINNAYIAHNVVTGVNAQGGGIYSSSSSVITIDAVTITENYAPIGAGFFVGWNSPKFDRQAATPSLPIKIWDNFTSSEEGATASNLYLEGGSAVDIMKPLHPETKIGLQLPSSYPAGIDEYYVLYPKTEANFTEADVAKFDADLDNQAFKVDEWIKYGFLDIFPTLDDIWVNGVKMTYDTYIASGSSTLLTQKPTSGGYAHATYRSSDETTILELHDFQLEAQGYQYDTDLFAAIVVGSDVQIRVYGSNRVIGTSGASAIACLRNNLVMGDGTNLLHIASHDLSDNSDTLELGSSAPVTVDFADTTGLSAVDNELLLTAVDITIYTTSDAAGARAVAYLEDDNRDTMEGLFRIAYNQNFMPSSDTVALRLYAGDDAASAIRFINMGYKGNEPADRYWWKSAKYLHIFENRQVDIPLDINLELSADCDWDAVEFGLILETDRTLGMVNWSGSYRNPRDTAGVYQVIEVPYNHDTHTYTYADTLNMSIYADVLESIKASAANSNILYHFQVRLAYDAETYGPIWRTDGKVYLLKYIDGVLKAVEYQQGVALSPSITYPQTVNADAPLVFSATTKATVDPAPVILGGVRLEYDKYLESGANELSSSKPAGGYAYLTRGQGDSVSLVLHNYTNIPSGATLGNYMTLCNVVDDGDNMFSYSINLVGLYAWDMPLCITLEGTNTINASTAINGPVDISIEGSSAETDKLNTSMNYGIGTYKCFTANRAPQGKLTIKNCRVDIESVNEAIYANGVVLNNAVVNVSAPNQPGASIVYGIMSQQGDITINNSTVTVGETRQSALGAKSAYENFGNVTIGNSKITLGGQLQAGDIIIRQTEFTVFFYAGYSSPLYAINALSEADYSQGSPTYTNHYVQIDALSKVSLCAPIVASAAISISASEVAISISTGYGMSAPQKALDAENGHLSISRSDVIVNGQISAYSGIISISDTNLTASSSTGDVFPDPTGNIQLRDWERNYLAFAGASAGSVTPISSHTESYLNDEQYPYIQIVIHEHIWQLQETPSGLLAVCTQEETICPYHGVDNGLVFDPVFPTVSILDLEGYSYQVGETDETMDTIGTLPITKYQKGFTQTYFTEMPTEAGEYYVEFCGYGDLTFPFTITPYELTASLFDAFDEEDFPFYTGSSVDAPAVQLDSMEDGMGQYFTADDYTVSGQMSGTDVGTYTLTITGKRNLVGSITKTWRVKGDSIEASDFTVTDYSATYDAQPHGVSVSSQIPGYVALYSTSENGEYSTTPITYTDAHMSDRIVWVKISATGYEESAPKQATIHIYRAGIDIVILPDQYYVYGDESYSIQYQVVTAPIAPDTLTGEIGLTSELSTIGFYNYDLSALTVTGNPDNYDMSVLSVPGESRFEYRARVVEITWDNPVHYLSATDPSNPGYIYHNAYVANIVTNNGVKDVVYAVTADTEPYIKGAAAFGNYQSKVVSLSGANAAFYKLPDVLPTSEWQIIGHTNMPAPTITDLATGQTKTWYTEKSVTITAPSGYRIQAPDGTFVTSFDYTALDVSNEIEYVLWRTANGAFSEVSTLTVPYDAATPSVDSVTVNGHVLGEEGSISAYTFYQMTALFEINASDAQSGVLKIEYQFLREDDPVPQSGWQVYNTNTPVTYLSSSAVINKLAVKVTDKAGCEKLFVSHPFVLFLPLPATFECVFYKTATSSFNPQFNLYSNSVSQITYDGDVVPSDKYRFGFGVLTFDQNYLKSLPLGPAVFTVEYNPANRVCSTPDLSDTMAPTQFTIDIQRGDDPISFNALAQYVYTGSAPEYTLSRGTTEAVFSYKTQGADDNTYVNGRPIEPGLYTIRAYVAETDYCLESTAIADIEIIKATPTISGDESSTIYNRKPTTAMDAVTSNSTGAITIEYKLASADDSAYSPDAPIDAGNYIARVTIAEDEHYIAHVLYPTFTISPEDLSYWSNIELEDANLVYNAQEQQVVIVRVEANYPSTDPGYMVLTSDEYEIDASFNGKGTVAAQYTLKVHGKGNFTGTATKIWEITRRTIILQDQYEVTYNGQEQTITFDGMLDVFFTATGNTGTDVEPEGYGASLTLIDANSCCWEGGSIGLEQVPWYIRPFDISGATITLDDTPLYYDGQIQVPNIVSVVKDGMVINDYDIESIESVDVHDDYDIGIVGQGNFTGYASTTYAIVKAPANLQLTTTYNKIYDGSRVIGSSSDFVMASNGTWMFEYKLKDAPDSEYSENFTCIDAGEYMARITVAENDYYLGDTAETTFVIEPCTISTSMFAFGEERIFNGQAQVCPIASATYDVGNGNVLDVDYEIVSGGEATDAGDYTVTVRGVGNYAGEVSMPWSIYKLLINNTEVIVDLDDTLLYYDGTTKTQVVRSVTFRGLPVTYDIEGNQGVDVGAYQCIITSNGNFYGMVDFYFVIWTPDESRFHNDFAEDGDEGLKVGQGVISVDVKKGSEETPTAKILSDKAALIGGILNGIEMGQVANGSDYDIWVEIATATAENMLIDDDVIKAMNDFVAKQKGACSIGTFVDIKMFKQLATEAEASAITELDESIKLSVEVPASLRKEGRTYYIVRSHMGEVENIGGEFDAATSTITFETDRFSAYAIGYQDYCSICHKRMPAGLDLCWLAWLITVIIILGLLVGAFFLGRFLAPIFKDRKYGNKNEDDNNAVVDDIALVAPQAVEASTAEGDDDEDEEDEEEEATDNGGSFARYNKSFTAKLIQASAEVQGFYGTIKNHLLGYGKVHSRISWKNDSFNAGRTPIAKFAIRGKSLFIYLPLTDEEIQATGINKQSEAKRYENVKSFTKVTGSVSLHRVIKAIDMVCARLGIPFDGDQNVDYSKPYESTDALVAQGLIKVLKQRSSVSVAEAQNAMTDSTAMSHIVNKERSFVGTVKAIINIDTIGENFADGETVDIKAIKDKGLINKKADYIKVLARGMLSKAIHVVADDYSVDAVKMIVLAGGTATRLVKKAK